MGSGWIIVRSRCNDFWLIRAKRVSKTGLDVGRNFFCYLRSKFIWVENWIERVVVRYLFGSNLVEFVSLISQWLWGILTNFLAGRSCWRKAQLIRTSHVTFGQVGFGLKMSPLPFWVEFGRICFVDISVAPRYFEKLFSWAILLAQGAADPLFTFTNEKTKWSSETVV